MLENTHGSQGMMLPKALREGRLDFWRDAVRGGARLRCSLQAGSRLWWSTFRRSYECCDACVTGAYARPWYRRPQVPPFVVDDIQQTGLGPDLYTLTYQVAINYANERSWGSAGQRSGGGALVLRGPYRDRKNDSTPFVSSNNSQKLHRHL